MTNAIPVEELVDKWGSYHYTITRALNAEECLVIQLMITEAQSLMTTGTAHAVYLNFPMALGIPTCKQLALLLPDTFPIDMIRDEQKQFYRFVDGPPSIPRGANCDLGATALVYDNLNQKVLIVTNKMNQRLCFPGGRCDVGESFEQTASREAREEAGIQLDPNQGTIVSIQTFPQNQNVAGVNIVVRWTLPNASETIKPQCDNHETSDADWMDLNQLSDKILPQITDHMLNDPGWTAIQKKSWYNNYAQ